MSLFPRVLVYDSWGKKWGSGATVLIQSRSITRSGDGSSSTLLVLLCNISSMVYKSGGLTGLSHEAI